MIDWAIDTAIEIASCQAKSAQRETEEIQPASAGFVCVDAVSTAVCMSRNQTDAIRRSIAL